MTGNPAASPIHRDIRLPSGRRHHFVSVGAGGPRVVLLHGFTDSWRSFELLFAPLSAKFQLFALDQRGHGASEPGDSYAIGDFADDAIAFIESLGGEPVHLIGHSLGSIVAQRVAQARPDLLASLILISAAPSAAGHAGLLAMRDDLAAFATHVPRDYARGFQASTAHRPIAPAQLDIFVDESMKLGLDAWRRTVDGLLGDTALADPINVPTLSIWGVRDAVFDALAQQALAHKIPGLVAAHYEDVGHAPHWEAPAKVARDIERFILSLPARPDTKAAHRS
ncbi:MAG: alpha/beta fold hydrolase [Roseiarcus sp.]|jgi:pimeloyl-ACP methyl ester carboxylesterase